MGIFKKDTNNSAMNINIPDVTQSFQEVANRNEIAEVLRELFTESKIYMITDLSKDEIKLCTRIHILAEMKNLPRWKEGLRYFITLMLSKDRKSRKELLEAMKGQIHSQSLMGKINPFGRRM
jgi:predicted DNA-binding protein YlxM (UPF0122 family)